MYSLGEVGRLGTCMAELQGPETITCWIEPRSERALAKCGEQVTGRKLDAVVYFCYWDKFPMDSAPLCFYLKLSEIDPKSHSGDNHMFLNQTH